MSIDKFFHKKYHRDTYNCAHFCVDVWKHLTGEDMPPEVQNLLLPVGPEKHGSISMRRAFRRLRGPESPSVAIFQRRGCSPHVGIFYRGRILHIHAFGVHFVPPEIVMRTFDNVRYYLPC